MLVLLVLYTSEFLYYLICCCWLEHTLKDKGSRKLPFIFPLIMAFGVRIIEALVEKPFSSLICMVILFAYAIIKYRRPILHKVLSYLALYLFTCLADLTTSIIFVGLLDHAPALSFVNTLPYVFIRYICLIIGALYGLIVNIVWKRFYREKIDYSYLNFIVIVLLQLAQIIIIYILYMRDLTIRIEFFLFISILLLSDFFLFGLFRKMKRDITEKEKVAYLQSLLSFQTDRNIEMMEYRTKILSMHHEMKNNFFTAKTLIDTKQYEEAQKVVNDFLDILQEQQVRHFCSHALIDAIISAKLNSASQKNIHIDVKIVGDISKYAHYDDVYLCSIFSNMLDNVIEACDKIPDDGSYPRNAVIKCIEAGGFLCIKTENTCPCIFDSSYRHNSVSSKKNRQEHGFGLEILRSIAKQYNGSLTVQCNANIFETTILLSTETAPY